MMEPAPGRALVGKPSTEELAGELMERAQADGVSLVGPGGLLADLIKRVLESMFGEGAKLIALAGFGFEEGEHAQSYRHVGLLWGRVDGQRPAASSDVGWFGAGGVVGVDVYPANDVVGVDDDGGRHGHGVDGDGLGEYARKP